MFYIIQENKPLLIQEDGFSTLHDAVDFLLRSNAERLPDGYWYMEGTLFVVFDQLNKIIIRGY